MQGNEVGRKIAELFNELAKEGFEFYASANMVAVMKRGQDGKLYTLGHVVEGEEMTLDGWWWKPKS